MPTSAHSKKGPTQLLTVAQAAERTGLSRRFIWQSLSSGVLTPIRFGRRATRIDEAEVEAFIEQARSESHP